MALSAVEHLADALVEVADRRVVAMPCVPHLAVAERAAIEADHRAQAEAVRIGLVPRNRPDRGQVDRVLVVEIPVALPDLPGVVRIRERDRQEERRAVGAQREVADLLHGAEADLVVVIGLQGRLAGARREQARGVVVPLEPLAGRQRPVRRPVEPRRVHVGRQALLEAVQLIGPDEVHLAGQRRLVAGGAQHVGDRRRGGGQLGGVVVGADRRGPAAGQQSEPRRGAQRRCAVRALEHDSVARERVQVRGLDDGIAVGGQVRRGQLIGHQEQDIRGRGRGRHAIAVSSDGVSASRRWV